MAPAEAAVEARPSVRERLRALRRGYGWFIAVVVAPTLLMAIYLYGFASDQYQSEAHFLVRLQSSSSSTSSGSSGLGGLLGGGQSTLAAMGDAASVSDYLLSHDALAALQKRLNLVTLFRRPEADALSELSTATPTPEWLLRFYKQQVDVHMDTDTGITTLTARGFRPGDAHAIAKAMLALGEARVNEMNKRAYNDAVSLSRQQFEDAERSLNALQTQMTAFRQAEGDANPTTSADAQIGLVSRLSEQLSAARTQLATTTQLIGTKNPQVDALRQQVRSLEAQEAAQAARLAGGGKAIAAGLGNFERLKMQQEFLAQRYEDASTGYQNARQQAIRQQLYVAKTVEPNMPVKSEYPQRGLILATMLAALLVIYSIGWLIAAGVREHAV